MVVDHAKTVLASAALGVALTVAPPAFAAPVSFYATAKIFNINPSSSDSAFSSVLGGVPVVDDLVSLYLTFDADLVTATTPIGSNATLYSGAGVVSEQLTFGSTTLTSGTAANESGVLVTTSLSPILGIGLYDGYSFQAGANASGALRWATQLAFVGGGLSNTNLPSSIPSLADFDGAGIGFRIFDREFTGEASIVAGFGALLTFVGAEPPEDPDDPDDPDDPVAVAEPGTLGLLALGLLALGTLRRRLS